MEIIGDLLVIGSYAFVLLSWIKTLAENKKLKEQLAEKKGEDEHKNE